MEIEQNTLSRDWIVKHDGRTFYVNFIESDGQTLALMNRDNWEITERTNDGDVELSGILFSSMTKEERQKAAQEAAMMKAIITYCIANWDNQFMQELGQDLVFHADNQK